MRRTVLSPIDRSFAERTLGRDDNISRLDRTSIDRRGTIIGMRSSQTGTPFPFFFVQRERRSRCFFSVGPYTPIVNCNLPWKSLGYKADSLASCCRSAKFYYGPYQYATNVFIKINMPSAESNFSEQELNLLK